MTVRTASRPGTVSKRCWLAGFVIVSAVGCRTVILCVMTMSTWSPARTRKSRPVTRSTWKAIAFSPGLSCALTLLGPVPPPIASRVTWLPFGIANRAGCPLTWDFAPRRVAFAADESTCCSSTLSGVTGSPILMSWFATSTVTFASAGFVVGPEVLFSRMTMPTNARIASRTPTKMTRRFDRFTNVFPLQLGG